MSNLRIKPIPAALLAVGLLTSVGVAEMAFAGTTTTPQPGVYALGTFNPTAYAVVARGITVPADAASTLTSGSLIAILKPAQTSWVYAMTGTSFDSQVTNAAMTLTATQNFSGGSGTTAVDCTLQYAADYNDVTQVMGVSFGNITAVVTSTGSAATSTGTTACKTAFNTGTGISASAIGAATKSNFNLIY